MAWELLKGAPTGITGGAFPLSTGASDSEPAGQKQTGRWVGWFRGGCASSEQTGRWTVAGHWFRDYAGRGQGVGSGFELSCPKLR